MSEDFEDDIKTEDFISNTTDALVVSQRIKDLLADIELKNNEWLSVSIINHRKRKVKTPYFILNQLNLQDCIDLEQSVFIRNAIDPDLFLVIKRLVVSEKKIEEGLAIFRMHHYPFVCLFHRSVAEKIQREACTGIEFRELEDWEPS
jgi:hypothetical protein